MSRISTMSAPRRQRGVVLFVALILLLVLTVLGVTLARMQTVEERMAQNETNHQLAFQAAEATVRAVSIDLNMATFNESSYTSNTNGQYMLADEPTMQVVPAVDAPSAVNWSAPGAATLPYDGPNLAGVPAPPQPSQFMIEELPPQCCPGSNCATTSQIRIYRITAHAVGPDGNASATLQQIQREGSCS